MESLPNVETFLAKSQEAYILLDQTQNIVFVNPKSQHFLGKSPASLIGTPIQDCGEICTIISEDLDHCMKAHTCMVREYRLPSPFEDQLIDLEIEYITQNNANSQQECLLILRDHSSIKKTLRDLKTANEHIETQNKALQYFQIVSESDLSGNITFSNRKFRKLYGYTKKDIKGLNYRDLNSGHHDKSFFQQMWKTIAGGEVWDGIIKNKTKNGKAVFVDTTITPIMDDHQNIRKFLTLQRDITKEQTDFETAQDFLQRFKDACLFSPVIMISLDLSGKIIFSNHHFQQLIGYNTSEIQNHHWLDLCIGKKDRKDVQNILLNLLSQNIKRKRFQANMICKDGSSKLISWKASPTLDTQNNTTGVSLVGEDITERKLTQKEIQSLRTQLDKERKKTLGFMTHQLKGGLASLRSGLSFLEEEIKGTHPDNHSSLQVLDKILEKLSNLEAFNTRFLQSLSNVQHDVSLSVKNVSLHKVLKELQTDHLKQSSPDTKVTIQCKPKNMEGKWDPVLLREVLDNLISNAIKYKSPKRNPNIKIIAKKVNQDQDLLIEVRDNGKGMTQELAQKTFTLFTRGQNDIEGFGVGLRFCKEVVQKHGGNIWVETTLGKGSTFFIRMPMVSQQSL